MFKHIASGEKIPKHNHTIRVDGDNIYSLIATIQDTLQIKAGLMIDVTISGYKFTNLLV